MLTGSASSIAAVCGVCWPPWTVGELASGARPSVEGDVELYAGGAAGAWLEEPVSSTARRKAPDLLRRDVFLDMVKTEF